MEPMAATYYDHRVHQILPVTSDPKNFTSEDDLNTFDRYLRCQGIDPVTTTPEVLAQFREVFDEAMAKRLATPPMGEIFKPKPTGAKQGEFKIAVAVRNGAELLLTMTVRRNHKGDVYVIYPRHEGNPHTSYHADGTFHHKSDNHAMMSEKRQPLTDAFKGCGHMGMFAGHEPKAIGAVCNPANFSEVIEIEPGILSLRDGYAAVDLVEPGCDPLELFNPVTHERVFKDSIPWIVVRVGSTHLSVRTYSMTMGWKRSFDDPIPLPRGRQLATLKDAADYITRLPKAEHESPQWQAAIEALIMAAEGRGPLMHARIGVMRALNRHLERVFNPDRKHPERGHRARQN